MAADIPVSDGTSREDSPKKSVAIKDPPPVETTFLGYLREWGDALVIAFVVAMFIRTFVVELFKIPSGSMSPTLLGDFVAEGTATDREGDPHQYLLISDPSGENFQVFLKKSDGYFDYQGWQPRFALTQSQQVLLSKLTREEHRILVNKFAYWFKKPERGDIVIFRVPFQMEPVSYERNGTLMEPVKYNRDQSVYVKRAVGFEGERLQIREDGHLAVNGEMVTKPEVLTKTHYLNKSVPYDVTIPKDHLVVFGDNSDNSLDSRYWGPLPEQNLRGKAILTYWPFKNKRFLTPD
jgi:signal peptidase I